MVAAAIRVNGVLGSDDDVPINTTVKLDNLNTGGEISYLWSILDQPEGSAVSLTSTTAPDPEFKPEQEGTYLVRLTVNQGTASEVSNQVIVGVRQLRTRDRVPSAGETIEGDSADGWALATSRMLRRLDDIAGNHGSRLVAIAGANLTRGDVVAPVGADVIMSTLPGEAVLLKLDKLLMTTTDLSDFDCYVVESDIDGNGSVSNGALCIVRRSGVFGPVTGAGVPGDSVYVSNTGALALSPGTYRRTVGLVCYASGGQYWVEINTSSRADKTIMMFGNTATPNAAGTTYADPGFVNRTSTANEAKITLPRGGLLKRMYVRCRTGTTGGNLVVTMRKNGANGAITATLAAAATTGSDLTHTMKFAEGDDLSVELVAGGGTSNGAADLVVSVELMALS